jgi:hypothetical protein
VLPHGTSGDITPGFVKYLRFLIKSSDQIARGTLDELGDVSSLSAYNRFLEEIRERTDLHITLPSKQHTGC